MENEEVAKNKAIRQFVSDNKPTEAGEKELIIRTGDAERILYPNKVRLSGVITAPAEFYNKRKELHDPNKCHVIYDKQKGAIKLVVDEQCAEQNYEVQGVLEDNEYLNPFKINSKTTFGVKDLMSVLKFNRVFFVDKDENAKIVLSLQNFKARADKTFEDSSNNRGTDSKVQITNLEHSLQEFFMLKMPLFKGGKEYTFKVDICVTASDGSVVVWLESRDLKDLQISEKNALMDEQLAHFSNIVCIEA